MSLCLFYMNEVTWGKGRRTTHEKKEIPLKKINIHSDVIDNIAQFTLVQNFSNTEEKPIEVSYTFPMPASSSVYDFQAKIGEKVIKGEVQEKETAKKNYNKAVSEGHGAYLAERIQGDIFSMALGNVPAKTDIEISIRYVIALKSEVDASQILLEFPTTIMPKYVPLKSNATEDVSQGKAVNPDKVSFKPYDFTLTGNITMSDGIVSVDSKVSKIKLENMREKSIDFVIDNLENLNETLLISIKRNKPTSTAMMETFDGKLTNKVFTYCTMASLVPDFTDIQKPNIDEIHYAIILDRSGSMKGDFSCQKNNSPMAKSIEAASLFVSMLPVGSSFDVYEFSSNFSKFTHKCEVGSIESKKQACEWIRTLDANGGTEMYPVLEDAYKTIKATNKSGVILLLTDGGVSNNDQIVRLVKANPNVSVFTIGIGDDVSKQLVEDIATEGHGHCELVTTDDIKPKVISQLRRAQQSVRRCANDNEVKITVDGAFKLVPETIPTLFEGDNNIFYIFSEQPVESIQYVQKEIVHNVPLTVATALGFPLHRIAALQYVDSLSVKKQGSQIESLKMDVHKDEIVQVSTELGIMSKHTSFLAVEYREDANKVLVPTEVRHVPLQSSGPEFVRECASICMVSTGPMTKSSSRSSSNSRSAAACSFNLSPQMMTKSWGGSDDDEDEEIELGNSRSSSPSMVSKSAGKDTYCAPYDLAAAYNSYSASASTSAYDSYSYGISSSAFGFYGGNSSSSAAGFYGGTTPSIGDVLLLDAEPPKQPKKTAKQPVVLPTPTFTITTALPDCEWITLRF